MIYKENGYKWRNYYKYNNELYNKYDYKRDGLLIRLIPPKMYKSENKVFRAVLNCIELPFVNLLKSVDILANFRNINWRKY